MNYDQLLSMVGKLPWFDLATVAQLSKGRRATLTNQLHRWGRNGRVIQLRRGMYTLPERYRRSPLNPAELSNALHRPSYLSGLWALSFYGIIPERVVPFTNVTTGAPRRFENCYGVFEYSHIKQSFFFGYRPMEIDNRKVLIATPEKALLDYWHLCPGDWTVPRLREMRFQRSGLVRNASLIESSERFVSPRLAKTAVRWINLMDETEEGTINI